MSKRKIPTHLKKAIWYAYDKKSGYEGVPIPFFKMVIDHIIPERIILNPKELNEFQKWKEKYNLSYDFNIQGIENLCPSTREFNLDKSDNGFYDKGGAYDDHIVRALTKAAELKPIVEHLNDKFKKELDKRSTNKLIDIINLIDKEDISLEYLIAEGLKVNFNDLKELENRERYDKILVKYQTERIKYYNFGEYFEITSALRYAVSYKRDEADFWINLFNDFLLNVYDSQVKKRVFYERTYAMFKCEKSWETIEVGILEYFRSMNEERNLEILRQGSLLYGIFCGEFEKGRIKSSGSTLTDIRNSLIKNLQLKISRANTNIRRADLMYSKLIIEGRYSIEEYEQINNGNLSIIDNWLDRYFSLLNTLIPNLEKISYFDFDEFYNTFISSSNRNTLLKHHNDYDNTLKKILNLKNIYEGVNSIVPTLERRAIELFNEGDYIKAIKIFNELKNSSFNPRNFYSYITALSYLGSCYEKLDLLYASKYYYLEAYNISIETDCEYNTKQLSYALGIDSAAIISFDLGSINEAIYYISLSIMLRDALSLTPIDYSTILNRRVILLLEYVLYILLYDKEKYKNRFESTRKLLKRFDLWKIIEKPLYKWKQEISNEEVDNFIKEHRLLFKSDENISEYEWFQKGIYWTIKWENKYIETIICEEFIAYLQIFLVYLSEFKNVLSNNFIIKIIISNKFNITYSENVSIIELPSEINSNYFGCLSDIILNFLSYNMKISQDQIIKEVEPLFKEGFFLDNYCEILETLITPDLFSLLHQNNLNQNQ